MPCGRVLSSLPRETGIGADQTAMRPRGGIAVTSAVVSPARACPCLCLCLNMAKRDAAVFRTSTSTSTSMHLLHAFVCTDGVVKVNPGHGMARASVYEEVRWIFTFQSTVHVHVQSTPCLLRQKGPCQRSSRDSSCPLGAIAGADLSELRQQGTWYMFLRVAEMPTKSRALLTGEPLIWTHANLQQPHLVTLATGKAFWQHCFDMSDGFVLLQRMPADMS
ncbi:hypothetical protein J3F84DRAFT_307382 [Trichoderma pleuroticola]